MNEYVISEFSADDDEAKEKLSMVIDFYKFAEKTLNLKDSKHTILCSDRDSNTFKERLILEGAIGYIEENNECREITSNWEAYIEEQDIENMEETELDSRISEHYKEFLMERGDCIFYLSLMCHGLGIYDTDYDLRITPVFDPKTQIFTDTGVNYVELLASVKRYIFQSRQDELTLLRSMVVSLVCGSVGSTTTMSAAIEAVKEKLTERYPSGKYRVEDCVNR